MRGLGDKIKRRTVFQYLRESKADIILLQESHCVKEKQKI